MLKAGEVMKPNEAAFFLSAFKMKERRS